MSDGYISHSGGGDAVVDLQGTSGVDPLTVENGPKIVLTLSPVFESLIGEDTPTNEIPGFYVDLNLTGQGGGEAPELPSIPPEGLPELPPLSPPGGGGLPPPSGVGGAVMDFIDGLGGQEELMAAIDTITSELPFPGAGSSSNLQAAPSIGAVSLVQDATKSLLVSFKH